MHTTPNIPLLDPAPLRQRFPALARTHHGEPVVYLDGPGGTQVPQSVIDAMTGFMQRGGANTTDAFVTGRETVAVAEGARAAIRDLINARDAAEIAFGQNMTSLTFSLSRSLARTWEPGDEIVVTRLDHDANISPWLMAAEDRGATVRWLDFDAADCTLRLDLLPDLLNARTRLVAITLASNAVGSITDVRRAADMAHEVGALVFVDCVHYAPHGAIDVQAFDCDFLANSAYKYFGPHTGILYGKLEHMASLTPYKVRPAGDVPPHRWETGTQSFESLAGVTAAVDYIAELGGPGGTRREQLERAMYRIQQYEASLSERFLRGAATVPGLRVYGITDIERLEERTPTFAVELAGYSADEVARALGERGIFVYAGHYYAIAVMERLDKLESGGLVRIGFVHYNTPAEVDRTLDALRDLAARRN